jgi:hypothetical protein
MTLYFRSISRILSVTIRGKNILFLLVKQSQLQHLFSGERHRILPVETGGAIIHAMRHHLLDAVHADITYRVSGYVFSDFFDAVR